MLECVSAMQEITKEWYEPNDIHAVAGGTSTPIKQGTSSRSEESGFPERNDVKRPRLFDSRTFQISQIQQC